ncbi:MAG: ChbG/HpnK family deacetylase [Acidimicrobiales bacterium]|nr:ChbG/HpnK family deacetylase [Acidimicrobiales bacterium]MCB1015615.1 ChbG/HpnK family deacetylase [Acidimicrobiales bacterium]MCB9373358.1 ChbG/HpnK family deacetylase [Microthrixaceae bacterium]
MTRPLIVNADDYGLTRGVSRAILEAHEHGVVTSTSVLVLGPAFAATAGWLRAHERLSTGLHLALVGEDPPLLSRREIPTLVDRRGRLPASWKVLVGRFAARRVDPGDVRREVDAQHQAFRTAGLVASHVDTHQHVHLWPGLDAVVLDAAQRWGVPAVRVPDAEGRGPVPAAVRRLGRRLGRAARDRGLRHPSRFVGLDDSGHLDAAAWSRLVPRLAAPDGDGTVEVGCHPGAADDPERGRYRWGFDWPGEIAALTDPALRRSIDEAGMTLVSYADAFAEGGTGDTSAGSNGTPPRGSSTGTGG